MVPEYCVVVQNISTYVAAGLVLLVPKLHCSVWYDIIVLCQTSKKEKENVLLYT